MDKQVIEKLTHITTVQQRTLEDLKEIKSLLKSRMVELGITKTL